MKIQKESRRKYYSPMASVMMLNEDAICASDLMGELLSDDDIGAGDIFISNN